MRDGSDSNSVREVINLIAGDVLIELLMHAMLALQSVSLYYYYEYTLCIEMIGTYNL